MMKRYLLVAAALVALIAAGAVFAVAGDAPPGPPPWVRSDGTIDPSRAPDEFEVSGPNGTEIVCANGRKLKVRKELLLGPPGKTPDELRAEPPAAEGRDLVWRCGRGKHPHLNPVLVPRSEDPLREGED
jgi:hypothetical protein